MSRIVAPVATQAPIDWSNPYRSNSLAIFAARLHSFLKANPVPDNQPPAAQMRTMLFSFLQHASTKGNRITCPAFRRLSRSANDMMVKYLDRCYGRQRAVDDLEISMQYALFLLGCEMLRAKLEERNDYEQREAQ